MEQSPGFQPSRPQIYTPVTSWSLPLRGRVALSLTVQPPCSFDLLERLSCIPDPRRSQEAREGPPALFFHHHQAVYLPQGLFQLATESHRHRNNTGVDGTSCSGAGGWGREQVGRQAGVSSLEPLDRLRPYACVCISRSHGTPGSRPNNTEDTAAEELIASHFPPQSSSEIPS